MHISVLITNHLNSVDEPQIWYKYFQLLKPSYLIMFGHCNRCWCSKMHEWNERVHQKTTKAVQVPNNHYE